MQFNDKINAHRASTFTNTSPEEESMIGCPDLSPITVVILDLGTLPPVTCLSMVNHVIIYSHTI